MRYRRKFLVPVLTFVLIVSMITVYTKDLDLTAYAQSNTTANIYGGTDYYIDAAGGNDSNSGTSEQKAWKNLTKANATTFRPGDRILLKAGATWENQQLYPKGSGEEGRPITITSYGDIDALGRPYIAANGRVENPITYTGGTYVKDMNKVGLTGAVVLQNQQYWEIYNLELSNDDNFSRDITSQNIVRDGINISIQADKLSGAPDKIMNHFVIENCYIHDIDGPSHWQKIHYGGIVFQVFGSKQYTSYENGAYYFQDVVIQNNSFYKTELHAVEFAFNWFGDSGGQYDESGKYHEGWEQLWVRTKDLYSRDVYIGHNYCESIGQGAIQLANTQNMTVEYNEVNGFLKRYNAVSCGLYLWAGADSVMQFNEVYDGPYNEYDGTPWDLEYTNFNVTYQYNYSHDNSAGWMAYMGNSSNSIARYNLSVDDNGVIVKNMLSTNYEPTYFVNNIFVYDASRMDYIHDYYFKDTVYFYNNIFYNYSASTPTKWYNTAYPNAFEKARFSNNVYYEAGGTASVQEPEDAYKITADPQFVSNPVNNPDGLGVDQILTAAGAYRLSDTSPLIDAGHYTKACGEKDFFGTDLYYGEEVDIGIYEAPIGVKVNNPVEKPLEPSDPQDRVNLAFGKNITASSTHSNNGKGGLEADKLVDGDTTTRWACADPTSDTYPVTLILDFGESTTFNEIYLDEYTDSGTNPRIEQFNLQIWNEEDGEWKTFLQVTTGMGHNLTLKNFGNVTGKKLKLELTRQFSSEYYTPTMTEIQVYNNTEAEGI